MSNSFKVITRSEIVKFGIKANTPYKATPFTFSDGVEGFTIWCDDRMFHRKFKNDPMLGLGDWKVVGESV